MDRAAREVRLVTVEGACDAPGTRLKSPALSGGLRSTGHPRPFGPEGTIRAGVGAATSVLPALLLAGAAMLLMLSRSPILYRIPGTDSGMFLYVAQHIMNGRLLYRDIWDHKPPLIYWIDAVALALTPGSLWGLWLIQAASLLAALLLSLAALGRVAGRWSALAASALWMLTFPTILELDANLTEAFALPLQFGTLTLLARAQTNGRALLPYVAAGVLGGLTVCLRPNLVGLWLSAGALLLITGLAARQVRMATRRVLALGGGACLVLAPVGAYFVLNGTFGAMVDATVLYNLRYSSAEIVVRLGALLALFRYLSPAGLTVMAVTGWLVALAAIVRRASRGEVPHALVLIALIDLPLETLLASAAGRQYPHYALACLPAAAVLVAYLLRVLRDAVPLGARGEWAPVSAPVFVGALLIAASITPVDILLQETISRRPLEATSNAAVEYVKQSTNPGDTVLVWGDQVQVNFLSGRASPTRYPYQLPLFLPGYQSAGLVAEFLADLQAHPPRLVIDTAKTLMDVPPLSRTERSSWRAPRRSRILPETEAVFTFICENYTKVATVGPSGWPVYHRRGDTGAAPTQASAPESCNGPA